MYLVCLCALCVRVGASRRDHHVRIVLQREINQITSSSTRRAHLSIDGSAEETAGREYVRGIVSNHTVVAHRLNPSHRSKHLESPSPPTGSVCLSFSSNAQTDMDGSASSSLASDGAKDAFALTARAHDEGSLGKSSCSPPGSH